MTSRGAASHSRLLSAPPPLLPLSLLLLLLLSTVLQAQGQGVCELRCPPGQRCQLQTLRADRRVHLRPVCVPVRTEQSTSKPPSSPPQPPSPPSSPPPSPPPSVTAATSCAERTCPVGATCVLREVTCVTPPCRPQPVCIADRCRGASCPAGHTCRTAPIPHSDPQCGHFPWCRYKPRCVPAAEPKPGFCPLSAVRDQTLAACVLDSDCASDLRCCPSAAGGGRCVPPVTDPCHGLCPAAVGACVVRNGRAECRERPNCMPGRYYCYRRTQAFCTGGADLVATGIPC